MEEIVEVGFISVVNLLLAKQSNNMKVNDKQRREVKRTFPSKIGPKAEAGFVLSTVDSCAFLSFPFLSFPLPT